MRPLGIPSGDDKLVQEVVRILLEGIYEPVFSQNSHGFRPERSCHTALSDIDLHWKGVKWIVDMDIKGFFDNIDHEILIDCLKKKIDDEKFIDLIRKFLKAGYLDNWKFHKTYSGTPQGGVVSPILANVVLHELDQFIREKQQVFNKGKGRQRNREYWRVTKQIAHYRIRIDLLRKRGAFDFMIEEARDRIRKLEEERSKLPAQMMDDENFRRLLTLP
jgi:RNA-directed DNA polymerase